MTCYNCDGNRCPACINPLQRQKRFTDRFFWFCCWVIVIGVPLTLFIRYLKDIFNWW